MSLEEELSQALARMMKGRSLRGAGLADRLARRLDRPRMEIIAALESLRERGLVQCRDWYRGEPEGPVTLDLPCQPSETELRWAAVLAGSLPAGSVDATVLQPMHTALEGFDDDALRRLVAGLLELRDRQRQLAGQPRFQVSARFLLGSSKLLDELPAVDLRRFGIDPELFPPFPGYLVVAGPPKPAAVVLVENPHCFEAAVRGSAVERAGWIVTYGYGLSLRQSQHGQQLASLLAGRGRLHGLTRAGSPPPIAELLAHAELYFWGDLDLEGLNIYQRLRASLPGLRLSALYRPMIQWLRDGGGHPYAAATAKVGQSVSGLDPTLRPLAELCARRGCDQESVDPELIPELCLSPL
jgi:hypothetical protein